MHIGCCGFQRSRDEYFRYFSLVEVQETFYQPPPLKTAERWRATAPADFEFTLKAWQIITHPSTSPTYRRLKTKIGDPKNYGFFQSWPEVKEAWKTTREIAQALGARWIVFQRPASFTSTKENIANLHRSFADAARGDFQLAWETRGPWDDQTIKKLCQDLGLVHCVDPFQRLPVLGEIAYFRLHGQSGYNYGYTESELEQLRQWCADYDEGYCLFNNVYMYEDAKRFQKMIRR